MPLFSIPDHLKTSRASFAIERHFIAQGHERIAGADEAGRGPLAGPVVAAAVIFPASLDPARLTGLTDSKLLSLKERNRLHDVIMETALHVAVCARSAQSIDHGNILQRSLEAMADALAALPVSPDIALFDGRDVPGELPPRIEGHAVIKGDQHSLTIAAASVIAKVTRDRMMQHLALAHPAYGFEKHKGYGSAHHRAQISAQGGVSRVHRFSFRPLRVDL